MFLGNEQNCMQQWLYNGQESYKHIKIIIHIYKQINNKHAVNKMQDMHVTFATKLRFNN